ncbi:phosphorylase superfamily domain-containing protein [Ditylenchus destructor]|nr:phosphorylase superfamily domain-containing protein [Ditylenchus destructor]
MSVFKIGIIGGTGLEDPQILANAQEHVVNTPYGPPSDVLIEGTINGVPCIILSRHGRKHQTSPSHINYRANIWALKQLGASVILASSASGSLREDIRPGQIVFLDSFIDRTNKREQSFYDGQEGHPVGICHIPMHPIFDELLRTILISSAKDLGIDYHPHGISVCIEGPRYSTRAESELYRKWGADLVNMTVCPEAILAKELAIPYASIALSTDYDCWKDSHETVSVELVTQIVNENAEKTLKLFVHAAEKIHATKDEFKKIIEEAKTTARTAVMDGGNQLNFDYL